MARTNVSALWRSGVFSAPLGAILVASCVDLANPLSGAAGAGGSGAGGAADAGPDAPDGPSPVDPLARGQTCVAGTQCASGLCVDGVCCESACAGDCEACNLAGSLGVCAAVPAGEDPRDRCAAESPATCGRDGVCDGQRACRRHAAGTVCAAGSCAGGTETLPRTCDGAGACRPAQTKACDPYVCAGEICGAVCAGPGACVTTSRCVGDKCEGKLPLGADCQAPGDCASNRCVDGVCCDADCAGACRACNLAATRGVCTMIAAGADPGNECNIDNNNVCAYDGACNGNGACRAAAAGLPCGAAACQGAILNTAPVCTGAGTCGQPSTRNCSPFLCDTATRDCFASCTSAAQCVAAYYCDNGTCRPQKILQLRFDEAAGTTAADGSGYANHGTLMDYNPPLWGPAVRGQVIGFPATDPPDAGEWVLVADSPSLDSLAATRAFTISLWVTLHDVNPYPRSTLVYRPRSSGGNAHYGVSLVYGRPTMYMNASPATAVGSNRCETVDHVILTDGRFNHVAMTFDGTTARLYQDGDLLCTLAPGYVPAADTTPLVLGGWLEAGPRLADNDRFRGGMDDLVVYNRALSAAEIQAIAAGGTPP